MKYLKSSLENTIKLARRQYMNSWIRLCDYWSEHCMLVHQQTIQCAAKHQDQRNINNAVAGNLHTSTKWPWSESISGRMAGVREETNTSGASRTPSCPNKTSHQHSNICNTGRPLKQNHTKVIIKDPVLCIHTAKSRFCCLALFFTSVVLLLLFLLKVLDAKQQLLDDYLRLTGIHYIPLATYHWL